MTSQTERSLHDGKEERGRGRCGVRAHYGNLPQTEHFAYVAKLSGTAGMRLVKQLEDYHCFSNIEPVHLTHLSLSVYYFY